MDRMIYTAMSGAQVSLEQQAVLTNNLANASTAGFKAQLDAVRAVPVQGAGVWRARVSASATTPYADYSAGPVNTTGRELDIALKGNAWLAVQGSDGREAYTRRGDLQINGRGLLVVAGRPVIGENGPIFVPLGAELAVGTDGTISALEAGGDPEDIMPIDRLKLVAPADGELVRGADGLFRGRAADPLARDDGARIVSGVLEGSNVSPVESMVAMMASARRYEMQMKVIADADENAERANRLLSIQG